MKTFKSATVSELLEELKSAEDMSIIGSSSYGDRYGTMQVMPITGAKIAYVSESGYSSTGWKVIDEDNLCDSDIENKVVLLNHDLETSIEYAITGKELIELLEKLGDEALGLPVVHGSDYGDRCHTTQANRVDTSNCGEVDITESGYSNSGWAIHQEDDCDEEDEEDGNDDEPTLYFCVN